jgi:two-component system, OmpR family, sensor histidine kinase KdpD
MTSSRITIGRARAIRWILHGSLARALAVAVGGPALATVLASTLNPSGTSVPALLYLLAVLATALFGRPLVALLSVAVSYVGFDYFFSPPVRHLLGLQRIDVVALLCFLAGGVAVSTSVARTLRARSLAGLRGRQLEALYTYMAAVLTGASLEEALPSLASALRRAYQVEGCAMHVTGPSPHTTVVATDGDVSSSGGNVVPLEVGGRVVGRVELFGHSALTRRAEAAQVKAFAVQLALTLERTRLREEAASARREAEASHARAALFSSVTHDLKTPLASIKTSASNLLEEGLFSAEDRGELIHTILEETERLERLVSNIMSLSRLRSGTLAPAPESVLIEDVVGSVLRRLRLVLAGREVSVLSEREASTALVDVVQIDQVLSNLLENAARFSPPRTPIEVRIAATEEDVVVRVVDRGSGFAADVRHDAFREFVRGNADGHAQGAGLGLAIAQAIVVAHRGEIWIEDTPGGGATLAFRLPSEPSAGQERPEPER